MSICSTAINRLCRAVKLCLWPASAVCLLAVAAPVGGQTYPPPPLASPPHHAQPRSPQPQPGPPQRPVAYQADNLETRVQDLERRLTQQQEETAKLQKKLAEANAPQDDAPKPEEGYLIGTDLDMKASWRHGLEIESANKDLRVHVGGRTQFDGIWLDDFDDALEGAGGVGDADSLNFRRARLRIDGTMYEVIEWAVEYDFVNNINVNQGLQGANDTLGNVANVPAPTDLWFEFKEVPVVGHIRIGNFKEPIGLEHLTSSRYLNFMERSYLQDAYAGPFNNGFTPGIMIFDTSEDKRLHYDFGIFKNNSNVFGYGVGGGEYAVDARLGYLVWYDEPSQGRYLAHLAISGSHRDLDDGRIRIRSRPSLRNGPGVLNPVIADTGFFFGDDQDLLGLEAAAVVGPWLFQAEYIGSAVSEGRQGARNLGTVYTHGYYMEALYFLTGEHRAYDHKVFSFTRVVPHENAFLVRGVHGLCHGSGAWQIGGRYNYLDLRDDGINGGIIQDWTLGLNWFLNPNMKIQWNYVLTHRDGQGGVGDGYFHGLGVRLAHDF